MEINLSATDIILAAHYAGTIEDAKNINSVKNNGKYKMNGFAAHYIGMLGEVAICKYLNINVQSNITFGGDGGVDLIYKNQTIQLKTRAGDNPEPRYIIFDNIDEFKTDWAILCSLKSATEIKIHGFTSKERFIHKHINKNFSYGDRVCLDEKYLNDISKFDEATEWYIKNESIYSQVAS